MTHLSASSAFSSATATPVILSNRLPVTLSFADRQWAAHPSSGGLVTALGAVLKAKPGTVWVGWPGCDLRPGFAEALAEASAGSGFSMKAVDIPPHERELFYLGFCNEVIWPLFHDLQSLCRFVPEHWRCYRRVNRLFAEAAAAAAPPSGLVWIHDYHLMLAAEELAALRPDLSCGFFLHIPFPPPDMFAKLPWREQVLKGLLAHRVAGFQTLRDLRNFIACCREFLGAQVAEEGGGGARVSWAGHECLAAAFPIAIDTADFMRRAAAPEATRRAGELRAALHGRQIIFGVDRLDYTKGIPHRLRAFRSMLERHPDLCGKVTFVQVVVPSREDIPAYAALKTEIEQLVARINGEFTKVGEWVPIHYVYRHLESDDLLAWYRAAQVALVTPLKDGMNLVAKEYCACSLEEDCTLILSEFAGAADELKEWAILVNPNDEEAVADELARACRTPPSERRRAMVPMRRHLRRHTVFHFADAFMGALAGNAKAPPPASLEERIRRLAGSPHRATLILDYDGTLAPIRRRPEQAAPDAELLDLLGRLSEAFRVHVVSGRPRGELAAWLGALPIGLHAEHGLWSRMPGEEWEANADIPEAWVRAWMGEIEPLLAGACRQFKGSFVERKEKSIAWHYRAVPEAGLAQKAALGLVAQAMNLPVLRETVDLAGFLIEGEDAGDAWRRKLATEEEQAEDAAEELAFHAALLESARGVEALHGRKVLEFRVKGIHKGLVVPRVLHPGHPVLAAGDDRTDEDLFRSLPPQAILVKVGEEPTLAAHRVPDALAMRRLLASALPARQE